jgi:hypothetical protein
MKALTRKPEVAIATAAISEFLEDNPAIVAEIKNTTALSNSRIFIGPFSYPAPKPCVPQL